MENHSACGNTTYLPLDSEDLLISENHSKHHMELKKREELILTTDNKGGLSNPRALLFLTLWYVFSGCTLFLNKFILSYMKGDPTILGKNEILIFSFYVKIV